VENYNLKPFFLGLIISSLGAILVFQMLNSTSWITYSSSVNEEYFDGDMMSTLDYTIEMEIGLREATSDRQGEQCYDERYCSDLDESWTRQFMEIPGPEKEPIDCANSKEQDEIEICEMDKAGHTGNLIITGGLVLLGITFVLACIGIPGYMPGWVLRLLGSLAAIAILVGAITWFVMFPDLNSDFGPGDDKWHLSSSFFLTLLGPPIILVGGFVWGNIERIEKEEDDWDEEDEDYYQSGLEDSAFTTSTTLPSHAESQFHDVVDVNWQGEWGDDGYEWIEHPQGSEIWYWRDQETGQWVRH